MTDAGPDERARRARTLRITGAIGLVAAVLFLITSGVLAGVTLAVLGTGNLLAAKPVSETGRVPTPVRIMIIVGGVGFVVVMLGSTILALTRA